MTRSYFDRHYAANRSSWQELHTLEDLNNRAFALLRDLDPEARDADERIKSAFDLAANSL